MKVFIFYNAGSSSESEDSFPTTLNEFGYKFNDSEFCFTCIVIASNVYL